MLVTMGRRFAAVLLGGIVVSLGALVWVESSSLASVPQAPTVPRVIWSAHPASRLVALTFDDGPEPGSTDRILAILRRYGAHATFFVLGRQAQQFPGYLQEIVRTGNEVENHSMSHRLLLRLGGRQILSEIRTSADLITELTGRPPLYFRPPYGSYNRAVAGAAESLRETLVLWTIDTRDWTLRSPTGIARSVFRQIRPGAIVLMHDGGGPRQRTVQALVDILQGLRARGYAAVTLQDLLHDRAPLARRH